MSYVTSITIVVNFASTAFREAVLSESDFGRGADWETGLEELNMDAAGGTKYPGHHVFAAGLNYADREALRAWCDALPWGRADALVLVDTEGEFSEAWVYGVFPEGIRLAGSASGAEKP